MAQALYRKFRSQTFDELIGQDHITKLLKNAVKQGKVSHAYLFVGSRGTGKTSTARILAKAVNCLSPGKDGNPCNKCLTCQAITNGRYLDLIEIDAASNRGIDQIRELKEKIEFSPAEGRYKVYIIDEVHMLTTEAFNALLKTLEEPPAHVIFILATTEAFRLPPTILSRCQRYDFRLGTDEQVSKIILKVAKDVDIELEKGAIDLLVKSAQGSYRDALSLLDVVINSQIEGDSPCKISSQEVEDVLGVPDSVMVVEFLSRLVDNEPAAALELLNELSCYGVNFSQLVKLTLEILREVLIAVITGEDVESRYPFINNLTQKEIIGMIGIFLEAERGLHSAVIPALIVEMVIPKVQLLLGVDMASVKTSSSNSSSDKGDGGGSSGNNGGEPDESVVSEGGSKGEVGSKDTAKTSLQTNSKAESVRTTEKKIAAAKKRDDTDLSKKNNMERNSEKDKRLKNNGKNSGKKAKLGKAKIKEIKKAWGKIKKEVKNLNGHLLAILQKSEVSGVSDDILEMNVLYEFHKDRLESPKSREVMGQVFEKVLGYRVSYLCKVEKKNSCKSRTSKDIILNGVPKGYNVVTSEKKESVSKEKVLNAGSEEDQRQTPRLTAKKVEEIFSGL